MSRALYRKYRARTLSEIRGQDHITAPPASALKSGKISHAYLFTGPRGTGKTSIARILAHEINNFSYELEDSYIDIIEIDAASNTGVDNIRDLRERAIVAPTLGKYKIYIIDEVHMLSKSAFNALLKTLEEPPAHVIFIMATTDPQKIPATILSRSQQYQFRLADSETMISHLKDVTKSEKIKATDEALALVAARGGGSFRDSLSLLDQLSTLTDEITCEFIESALGLPSDQLVTQLLSNYGSADGEAISSTLAELSSVGVKPEIVAEQLISKIIADPQPQLLPLLDKLTEVARSPFPHAKLLLALLTITSNSPKKNNVIACAIEAPKKAEMKAATPIQASPEVGTETSVQKNPEVTTDTTKRSSEVAVSDFTYEDLVESVSEKSQMLATKLQTLGYDFDGQTLTVYSSNKVNEKLLKTDKNFKNICAYLPTGVILNVAAGKKPSDDQQIAGLSDIIGIAEEVEVIGVFDDAAAS